MTKNIDIIYAAVGFIIKAAILAARLTADPSVHFPLSKTFAIKDKIDQRVSFNFFTGYERYGYSRTVLKLSVNCKVDKVMIEKTWPSQRSLLYGVGRFIDSTSRGYPGEMIEFSK